MHHLAQMGVGLQQGSERIVLLQTLARHLIPGKRFDEPAPKQLELQKKIKGQQH